MEAGPDSAEVRASVLRAQTCRPNLTGGRCSSTLKQFPARGPKQLSSSVIVSAAALGLLLACGDLTQLAFDAAGSTVALLGVFLPVLTLAFWSAAHFVRVGVERLTP